MPVDQKLLLSHLSAKCFKAVEGAFAAAVRARSREVTIEHVVVALLDDSSTELALLVEQYQLDVAQLRSALTHAAGSAAGGGAGVGTLAAGARPALSPALFQWLEEAWMLTSLELGRHRIGSGIVFLKLIQQAEKYGASLADTLGTIPVEYVKKDLRTIAETAQETGTETRWTSAEVKPLAEAASSVAAGSLPAAYEVGFASLRDWLAGLAERGSGLSLAVDQDVWVLRPIGGAPPKRVAPATPEPVAPQVEPPAAAQSADPPPAAFPPAAEELAPVLAAPEPAPPPPASSPAPAPTPAPAPAPAPAPTPAPAPPAPDPPAGPASAHDERPPPSRAGARTDAPDAKTLLRRLTKTCVGAMERAAAHAIRNKHYEITPEHFLFELLAEPGTDMAAMLAHFALDREQMRGALDSTLSDMRGGTARPNFAPQLLEWIHDSDLAPNNASGKIRSGVLFFRFVQQGRKYTKRGSALGLEAIPFEELKKLLPTVLKQSPEASEASAD